MVNQLNSLDQDVENTLKEISNVDGTKFETENMSINDQRIDRNGCELSIETADIHQRELNAEIKDELSTRL